MNGTLNGIACAKCSHWENGQRVQVKHATIEDVRNCPGRQARANGATPPAEVVVTSPRFPDVNVWAKVRAVQDRLPNVKRMHYAIQVVDLEKSSVPVWKFYRVEKPQKGKWAGRTFVSVQASDEHYPVKHPDALLTVLSAIAADPAKAASNYGHQIGACGMCSRTLTDPASIERGIGPICADKAGW